MIKEEIFYLKNGDAITLAHITLGDVDERHEFFVKLSMEQVGMVHTVDEIDIHTHETYEKIDDFIKKRRGLWLLAFDAQKKVVGEVDILIKNLARVRHNGFLTVGISKELEGQGLGSLLVEQALLWAKKNSLLRIELSVFKNNLRAQFLYQKFNFVVEGVRKNFLRHQDGSFEDDLLMAKYL